MKTFKIIGRIILVMFIVACFILVTMIYKGCERANEINESNSDITIWHKERDEIYSMEQTGFEGIVTHLSPGLHRHDIDTVTVKLQTWNSSDSSFKGENYLHKLNDSTLLLFISYSESLWRPNQIDIGDGIKKEQFGFDFSIYGNKKQFKKDLSLLFCFYENPDTIIQKDGFIYGLYGNNKLDTLFSGAIENKKRNGNWSYYQAHTSNYKIFEGEYKDNKRNGKFKKYYEQTDQLIYEENYKDNMPNGQFTWWFNNGQVESKKYFDNGNPIGTWEYFNDKGELIKKVNYSRKKSSR
jgi:hypothetical protein